ncbi:DUF1444 family protein [Flammeovirga agarivorans]|uniref:DUF1444 family protein n=1 Tax=Flammeovirga agarivorans TaxID=2726742 RepID=A0A7X8SMI0_9BACT|nr:DUF1444 family protein [Flammeovirga agarivorans]NLR92954.1 DUF1444 family protein [Flammeovirga agarivorans]
MKKTFNIFFTLLFLITNFVVAQDEQELPYGRFSTDSIMLGEEIKYTLRYEHNADDEVLFVDSTYNFTPFELLNKEFFPTRSVNNVSIDCVIYTLATYEIDSVYELGLPVLIAENGTTDSLFAHLDGVFFKDLIQVLPDTAKVIADVNYVEVQREFNYPYLMIFIGIIFAIALIVVFGFGGKIREHWRKKKVQKAYDTFISSYKSYLGKELSSSETEDAVALWKGYLAAATNLEIQALTSKEIGKVLVSKKLEEQLKLLDRVIYSGSGAEEAKPVLKKLQNIANKGFAYALANEKDKAFILLEDDFEKESHHEDVVSAVTEVSQNGTTDSSLSGNVSQEIKTLPADIKQKVENTKSSKEIYPLLKTSDWVGKDFSIFKNFPISSKAPLPLIAFGYDLGEQFMFYTKDDLKKEKVSEDAIYKQAMANLKEIKVPFESGPGFYTASGNDFSAEKILDTDFLLEAQKKMGAYKIIVAIPRRTVMYLTDANSTEEQLKLFQKLVHTTYLDDSYGNAPITNLLFTFEGAECKEVNVVAP